MTNQLINDELFIKWLKEKQQTMNEVDYLYNFSVYLPYAQLFYQAFAFTGLLTGDKDQILMFGDFSYNKEIINAVINSKYYEKTMKFLKDFTNYAVLNASNKVITGAWTEKKLYKENYEEICRGIENVKAQSHNV